MERQEQYERDEGPAETKPPSDHEPAPRIARSAFLSPHALIESLVAPPPRAARSARTFLALGTWTLLVLLSPLAVFILLIAATEHWGLTSLHTNPRASVLSLVLFSVWQLFDDMQASMLRGVITASPMYVAPFDKWCYTTSSLALFFTGPFGVLARVAGIAFLVYSAFRVTWYYPFVLYAGAFVVTLPLHNYLRFRYGLRWPALLGYIVMPVVGVWMWFTV